MSIMRAGFPLPIRGTAPQVPAAPLADVNALQPYHFFHGGNAKRTSWIRIDNLGANPLRLYFLNPGLDPATGAWLQYYELPATTGFIEGFFELDDLWLAGVGGTTTFKGILGIRYP